MRHFQLIASLLTLLSIEPACHGSTEPGSGSGDILWRSPGASQAGPAVSDSTVYFTTLDHGVTALDARTGALRWRVKTGESAGTNPGENVLVIGSEVVVPDLGVYGFDRATGAQRWSFHPPSGDTPGRFSIATDGSRVFTGSAAGYAYGIDATTGQGLWTTAIAVDGNSVVTQPVYDRGLVFLSVRHYTNPFTGGIAALDAMTGAVRWQRVFTPSAAGQGSGSITRVATWGELVIASSDDGSVHALDRSSGAIVWRSPRPAEERTLNDQRPLTVVGDAVVVGSDLPLLTGLDAATGQRRWTIASAFGSVDYEMGRDASYAYVTYVGLQISAIDAAAGKIAWTSGTSQTGNFSPNATSDGERVYSGGFSGLYALRR